MKLDVGALIDEPSLSSNYQIEINFSELLKTIFGEDVKEEKNLFFNNVTYLN